MEELSPYDFVLEGAGDSDDDAARGYLRASGYHTTLHGSTAGVYVDACWAEASASSGDDIGGRSLDTSQHTDWNREYQELLEKDDGGDVQVELERIAALRRLYEEFARTAAAIGTTIISERYLSPENRSLEVTTRLGVAGGEKYIHAPQRLFFKLCVNTRGIYSSDEAASKAAGNELRGIMEYVDTRVAGLRFPLVVCIDFLGYRLMAQSILPINKKTLVYGSADGGRTVQSSDPSVAEKMERCARLLNLTTHEVYNLDKTQRHRLSACIDIEVHRGTDQRLYVIDCARVMPCTKPVPGLQGGNLYQLFRPEFVRNYDIPLCPDAYGGWPLVDRERLQGDIDRATERLMQVTIPEFARSLDARSGLTLEVICRDAHRAGINMRYLGVVRACCQSGHARTLLTTECLVRTLKQVIRGRMRAVMSADIEAHKSVVLEAINSLMIGDDAQFYGVGAKRSMMKRFAHALTAHEIGDASLDVRTLTLPEALLRRLTGALNVSLTKRSTHLVMQLFAVKGAERATPAQLWERWRQTPPGNRASVQFQLTDIVSMIPRVKTLHVVPFAEGTALAKMGGFDEAYERYEQNLEIKPSDLRALHNWGISNTLHGMATRDVSLFHKAIGKFRTCISINSTDWIALYLWGNTLLSWFIGVNEKKNVQLLLQAREKYQEAWLMCVGTLDEEKMSTKMQELLYAWGNTYLYEEDPEPAVQKYMQALQDGVADDGLSRRLRFNLAVAYSRLNKFSKCDSVFRQLEPGTFELYFNWGNAILRHARREWGSLGKSRLTGHWERLEEQILRGLQMYVRAYELSSGSYVGVLANWGALLFLWSEIRWKLYGTHASKERAGHSLGTPTLVRRKAQVESETEEDEEEDEPESSTSESGEEAGEVVVSEDVYVFAVDFYLHAFLSTGAPLAMLVPLGSSKDLILSAHTIGAILSVTTSGNARESEEALSAIRVRGGNGKLHIDPEFTMYLPEVVASTIERCCSSKPAPMHSTKEAPSFDATTIVGQQEMSQLFQGDTWV